MGLGVSMMLSDFATVEEEEDDDASVGAVRPPRGNPDDEDVLVTAVADEDAD